MRRRPRQLITDATRTPEQNLRSRERVYMILQMLRLPFILLAIVAAWYLDNWWLAGILFVVSIPLPWVAVMIGNGKGEKRDRRSRNVYKPAVAREYQRLESERRRQLEAGGPDGPDRAPDPGQAPTIIEHDETNPPEKRTPRD
ncbi:Protein of unknown function [Corynebacterium timonense]|uniref:DUF3099 domain-containing protein n=2 Tax=Corynebacterium timonense TaxID=441500 RepID=A0A1H1NEN6_9CORY|nr:Protein of unknown function [Corynebacterium timonense]